MLWHLALVELAIVGVLLFLASRWRKVSACLVAFVALKIGLAMATFVHTADTGRSTMAAGVFAPELSHEYSFEQVPTATRNDETFILRVEAAGLNPSNFKVNFARWALVRHLHRWVIGYDVAGTVVSVGSKPECGGLRVGDRVWGMAGTGGVAEYTRMRCGEVPGWAHLPQNMTFEEAGGLAVAGMTAVMGFERSQVQRGDDVLVLGASGGCGMFGVMVAARSLGASVTGLCSGRNAEFVRGLGAARVVDYTNATDVAGLREGGARFDVIYDTVSSSAAVDPDYEPEMRPLLKPGGRYLAIGPSPSQWDFVRALAEQFLTLPLFGLRVQRPGYDWFLLRPTRRLALKLNAMFERGELGHVPIDSTFVVDSDASLVRAMDRMKSRRAVGKIVVKVQGTPAETR